jgi:hypothetical protein
MGDQSINSGGAIVLQCSGRHTECLTGVNHVVNEDCDLNRNVE